MGTIRITKKWVILLTVLTLLVAGAWILWSSGFFQAAASIQGLRSYIDQFSPYSHFCFFVLQVLSVVLAPIPSNITAAAGGMLFGTWPSFVLTFGAVIVGSLLVFWLARVLGQSFADRVVSKRVAEKYREIIEHKTTIFLFLAFLFPYFPDDVLCILAGLTHISIRRFGVIVLLARPWGLLFASALGGSSVAIPPWALVLLGVAGVVVFVMGIKYADRWEQIILTRLRAPKKS